MSDKVYPYIPNSNPAVRKEMLDFIGASSVEEIYSFIPEKLRLKEPMNLPKPLESEYELKKYIGGILDKNITSNEYSCFLGAGCYDHIVPALCDEINQRSEFLTAYSGDTYADHGKQQCFFEFSSMMGELLHMDVVGFPTYDGGQAASNAITMSKRITGGRKKVLVPENMNPNLLSQFENYCEGMEFVKVKSLPCGQLDLADLEEKCTEETASVWIANPAFLGFFEEKAAEIGAIAHKAGALFIVYADPASLGVAEAPADYGADMVCGEIQPLGIHMNFGGGQGGYLAFSQEERFVMNYPGHLHQIFFNPDGQFGFGRALPERTSYYQREKGVEYLGTCVGLWAVTACVYLAVMGPRGMQELGENILYKVNYAEKALEKIPGITLPYRDSASFLEFVVNFDGTGKTVEEVNKALLGKKILGGYNLGKVMPELGESMLIAVTEKTEIAEIDGLAAALTEILQEVTE